MISTLADEAEKAVLVGITNYKQAAHKTKEYLDELAFLAETLGVQTIKRFTQAMDRPDRQTFIKSGKLLEIVDFIRQSKANLLIFDDELSATHLRNIEKVLKEEKLESVQLLDRSSLILEIFRFRAQTAQAHTQVELARYQYMLPRLTRMWTHLSRQRGGIGMKGAGEKEIETDRRIIKDKISLLKEKLKKIEQQASTRRKSRGGLVRVALVGYTNVGKSTLMRLLTKADVFAENKLFATVDSTVRKLHWNGVPFLVSDTVGFIRKLPTMLIESFKSTLAEIVEADVLLHVIDVSHAGFEEQINIVNQTLTDIKAADKPMIYVFNKIDQYLDKPLMSDKYLILPPSLEELEASYLGQDRHSVFISAVKKLNVDTLKKILWAEIQKKHLTIYPNYLPRELDLASSQWAESDDF
ncbi:MAG: GTPase HflX [Cytophagales bacterium]|nr:MAG: GTPase HflX [Cytophagales bacterium]TAF60588.1 MAG: GTPase HflX [Cytophagales bacterium]